MTNIALRFVVQTRPSLQIPPRDGRPCFRLTSPATERVATFHR